jgi:hypothetical protein
MIDPIPSTEARRLRPRHPTDGGPSIRFATSEVNVAPLGLTSEWGTLGLKVLKRPNWFGQSIVRLTGSAERIRSQELTRNLNATANALAIGSSLERFDNHLDGCQLRFEMLQNG